MVKEKVPRKGCVGHITKHTSHSRWVPIPGEHTFLYTSRDVHVYTQFEVSVCETESTIACAFLILLAPPVCYQSWREEVRRSGILVFVSWSSDIVRVNPPESHQRTMMEKCLHSPLIISFLGCWFLSVTCKRSKAPLLPSAVLLVWLRSVPSDVWVEQGEEEFPV